MSYNEYLATGQNNYTFPQTFNAGGRFPIIAKSIWETLADAQGYVDDYAGSNAHVGQILSVIGDGDNNGIYQVSSISTEEGEYGVLTKIGDGSGTITVEDYTEALTVAASDNAGQIIYVSTSETIGTGDDAVIYDSGLYYVVGDGELSKIGTTTASGDFGSDISDLQGRVGDLEAEVGNLDLGDENVIESITVNGTEVAISDKTAAITFTDTTYDAGDGLDLSDDNVFSIDDEYITDLIPVYSLTQKTTADTGMASTYEFSIDDVVTTTINIPLDQVLSSATIETADEEDESGFDEGTKYIKFVFQNSDTPQYLAVTDLVDVYSGSTYITVGSDNAISLNYDSLKTNLSSDLGIDSLAKINTIDTTVDDDGLGLTFSDNTLGVSLNISDLKAKLNITDTDTTYSEGDYITIDSEDDNSISVDVESLTVSLVSDTTTGGVGDALSTLSGRLDDLEEVEITIPSYTPADDTIIVAEDGDNFTLKVDVSKVNTDTTYSAADNGGLTLSADNKFSVDVVNLTVSLVSDTTTGGVGAALASKADSTTVTSLSDTVTSLSDTVEILSEAMTWGTIGETEE